MASDCCALGPGWLATPCLDEHHKLLTAISPSSPSPPSSCSPTSDPVSYSLPIVGAMGFALVPRLIMIIVSSGLLGSADSIGSDDYGVAVHEPGRHGIPWAPGDEIPCCRCYRDSVADGGRMVDHPGGSAVAGALCFCQAGLRGGHPEVFTGVFMS